MSYVLLLLGLVAALLSWNSVARRAGDHGPIWFLALVTGELAPFAAALRVAIAAVFVAGGWAGGWAGRSGLVLLVWVLPNSWYKKVTR